MFFFFFFSFIFGKLNFIIILITLIYYFEKAKNFINIILKIIIKITYQIMNDLTRNKINLKL